MTNFEFGDVILVPFPFTDQTTSKKRPAVVISSAAYNRQRPDLIIMAITSQARPANRLGEVSLQRWQSAGLLKPSVIKPVVTTVHKGLVLKKLGRLTQDDVKRLEDALKAIIA